MKFRRLRSTLRESLKTEVTIDSQEEFEIYLSRIVPIHSMGHAYAINFYAHDYRVNKDLYVVKYQSREDARFEPIGFAYDLDDWVFATDTENLKDQPCNNIYHRPISRVVGETNEQFKMRCEAK